MSDAINTYVVYSVDKVRGLARQGFEAGKDVCTVEWELDSVHWYQGLDILSLVLWLFVLLHYYVSNNTNID